jgi:hypothetical protein
MIHESWMSSMYSERSERPSIVQVDQGIFTFQENYMITGRIEDQAGVPQMPHLRRPRGKVRGNYLHLIINNAILTHQVFKESTKRYCISL